MQLMIPHTVLDDGQVIEGRLDALTQYQIISYANQLYRAKFKKEADVLMRYQHEKFYSPNPPELPEAA